MENTNNQMDCLLLGKDKKAIKKTILGESMHNGKKMPKVSIVLPTYNGAKYIQQSIDSCLNQTYKNVELIIVDDCSTDETSDIIKSYEDERIKYIRHEKNKDLPTALNTGFKKAKGEYLTWTSDDNYYSEDAIEKMVSVLNKKNHSFVYCDHYRFKDENPEELRNIKLADASKLNEKNTVGACFLYSKKVKEAVGDYDVDAASAEDFDYWLRVSKKFSMYHLNETLYFYREHSKSISLSRYYEVRAATVLVQMKNNVLNVNMATDSLLNLMAHKRINNILSSYNKEHAFSHKKKEKNNILNKSSGQSSSQNYLKFFTWPLFLINKAIVKILFSKKISEELKDFENKKKNLKETKLFLRDIIISYK